jgi:hypothetical protein
VHDNYLEVWKRVDTPSRVLAMRLLHGDRKGVWVVVGGTFGVAIGRSSSDPLSAAIAPSAVALFERESLSESAQAAFVAGYTCSVGDATGSCWTVRHSTRPAAESAPLFGERDTVVVEGGGPLAPGRVVVHTMASPTGEPLSWRWEVVQVDGFDATDLVR